MTARFGIGATVVGTETVKRTLTRLSVDLGRNTERAVETSLLRLQERIQGKLNNDVLQKRTGTLFRSIHHEMTRAGIDSWGVVGTPIVYARIHEFGGTIVPKRAPYLRFKIGDQWFARKSVTMPARPYMGPSFDELHDEIVQGFRDAVQDAIDAAQGGTA